MSLKNSSDTIGNRTRDLSVALLHLPEKIILCFNGIHNNQWSYLLVYLNGINVQFYNNSIKHAKDLKEEQQI
jgi:hypothetical protein